MPELPEVESIKRQLEKYVVGHKISGIEVRNQRSFPIGKEKAVGKKVKSVRRFGKVLVIDLDNGYSIIAHVKMTGQFIYRGPNLKEPCEISEKVLGGLGGKHTHVIFTLDKGGMLYFNDVRKFGWLEVYPTNDVEKHRFIGKLGKEPLKDLSEEELQNIISKSNKPIKVLIMDQEKIAGIGNIYANDALYLAQIHPATSAKSLSNSEIEKLFRSIEKVLKKGIEKGGASERSFVTPDGSEGSYQEISLVYGKQGKACVFCGTKIEKIELGGRGTFFCPHCQNGRQVPKR